MKQQQVNSQSSVSVGINSQSSVNNSPASCQTSPTASSDGSSDAPPSKKKHLSENGQTSFVPKKKYGTSQAVNDPKSPPTRRKGYVNSQISELKSPIKSLSKSPRKKSSSSSSGDCDVKSASSSSPRKRSHAPISPLLATKEYPLQIATADAKSPKIEENGPIENGLVTPGGIITPLVVDTTTPRDTSEEIKSPPSEKRESRRGRHKCFKCVFHGTKEGIVRHVQGTSLTLPHFVIVNCSKKVW